MHEINKKMCEYIYGMDMQPCPECGSYDIGYSTPIKLPEELPGAFNAKEFLKVWSKAVRGGATPLVGTSCMICRECGHRGPSIDVSGRTKEDVGKDPKVADELKRLWNSQKEREAKNP
jgi:hypothetical protein